MTSLPGLFGKGRALNTVAVQEKPERGPRTSEAPGLVHDLPPPTAALRPGHQAHLGPDGAL